MAEDGRSQIVHYALADLIREERLDDAEHAVDDRDRDHPRGCIRERPRVVLPDRLQGTLEQEGRDDAEAGRDDDQEQHRAEPAAVRGKQRADAPQVGAPQRRVGRPFRHFVRGVEEHSHTDQRAQRASSRSSGSNRRPRRVSRYSTAGGRVSSTRRSSTPASTSSISRAVSVAGGTGPSASRSSLKRLPPSTDA